MRRTRQIKHRQKISEDELRELEALRKSLKAPYKPDRISEAIIRASGTLTTEQLHQTVGYAGGI